MEPGKGFNVDYSTIELEYPSLSLVDYRPGVRLYHKKNGLNKHRKSNSYNLLQRRHLLYLLGATHTLPRHRQTKLNTLVLISNPKFLISGSRA